MSLMVSISGVRGIVGDSLTPDVVVRYSAAFAEYCKRGKIVVGRDGRVGGKIVGNIVASSLLSMGCDVVALGVVPTPTVQIAVEHIHAAGGISITASHNPIQWNGMKFLSAGGMFLSAEENEHLWAIVKKNAFSYVPWDRIGRLSHDESIIRKHADMVLQLSYLDVGRIKNRKFKVVVDCINASGGVIVPGLLRELGCTVVEMNCDMSGVFARTPEPIPENLGEVCRRVRNERADLGIVVDPDADRLVLITEKGEPFGEEYTVTAVVDFVLSHDRPESSSRRQKVVVNLSTTRAVEDVAKHYGAEVIRTPVGEINVAKKMQEVGAVIGGEGSGGVILPAVHYGRDAIVGIGLILQRLAELGGTLSELKSSLPQYVIAKSKVEVQKRNVDGIFEQLRTRHASDGKLNTGDGLKIDFADSWVHLRKSNTEPIVRVIAEAATIERAEALVGQFTNEILTS